MREITEFHKIKNAKRILFVHQFLAMGDAIFLSPVYKTIKDNVRGVDISVLTDEYSLPFVKAIPFVDHVYPFESIFRRGAPRVENFLRLCIFLIKYRFDTIILRGDKRFPQRVFNLASKICLLKNLSMRLYLEEEVSENRHIVDTYFKILERIGFEVKEKGRLYLNLPDSALSEAKTFLGGKYKKLAGIAPVSNIKIKNWVPEKTAELIHKLKGMSYDVVLFCADTEFSDRVQSLMGNSQLMVIRRIEFPLLMGIISLCKIFIGVDTGPTHLAAALRVPTIGLYGPTSSIVTGLYHEQGFSIQSETECPYYLPTSPYSPKEKMQECYLDGRCRLPIKTCTDSITIQEVMEAVHRIIQSSG